MRIITLFILSIIYAGLFEYVYLANSDTLDIDNYLVGINRFSEYKTYWPSITAWVAFSLVFWALYEWASVFIFHGDGVYSLLLFSLVGLFLIARVLSNSRSLSLVSQLAIIFLLLNPRFLDLALSQQRNFLAAAFVITGFLVARRSLILGYLIITFATLIHLSTLLFLFLLIFYKTLKKFNPGNSFVIFFATIFSVVLITAYIFAEQILGRQVLFQQSSYLYATMWFGLTVLYIAIKPSAIQSEFGFTYYVLILISVLGMSFGIYGSRLIGLAIPFLAVSIHHENIKNPFVLIMIFIIWVLSLGYWIKYQVYL